MNERRNINEESILGPRYVTFERYAIALVAFIAAGTLIIIALWGPAGLNVIQYRTSQSGIYQTIAQDIVNVLLIVPLLLVGGALLALERDGAKYFLILPPITLFYNGLAYGIGQEWSNSLYTGNVERYSVLFLVIIISGLILGMGSLSLFSEHDAPSFNARSLKIYVSVLSVFLLFFAVMWLSELVEVAATGTTSSGAYDTAPTAFWVVRYFDLGISIPVGFISLYMLMTRPKSAYPIILLFFGFFITLGTSVNAMAIVQLLSGDPEVAGAVVAGLVIFPILGILAWGGLLYLLKEKIPFLRRSEN
ncbi:MAG: hypothetical protein ACFFED_00785 [Candidatus Thorarchaeota archaeon]